MPVVQDPDFGTGGPNRVSFNTGGPAISVALAFADWIALMIGFSVLDFTLWGRPGKGHEIASSLVSGVRVRCELHHSLSRARLDGVLGPSLAGMRRKIGEN